MSIIKKTRKLLELAENFTTIFIFVVLFITLFLQFFTRYVLDNSLGWTEEIARMLLICLCFSGAVINARNGSEVGLEFLSSKLSEEKVFKLDTFILKPLCLGIYIWLAIIMTMYCFKMHQFLSSIKISKKYFVGFSALCLFLMAGHTIHKFIIQLKKARNCKKEAK